MPLSFVKYHGLGNDFVVVEDREVMSPERAIRLCDRRRGIGADGVLSVLPPRGQGVATMHIYNPDGSVPEMCGNGIRCVSRHLADRRGLSGEILIETGSGLRRCRIHRDDQGQVDGVSVDMGTARIEGEQDLLAGGERLRGLRVSMGNPHLVLFDEDQPTAARALAVGPLIEKLFEGGVNVGFARPSPRGLHLVVWERGAGLTQACGTGACAAAAAALQTGRVGAGSPIEVKLPGGVLMITVSPELRVEMRGPAERVFEGQTSL